MNPKAQAIHDYWFGDLNHSTEYFKKRNRLWFGGGPKVDDEIRKLFGSDLEVAAKGGLQDWRESPKECMALVVLLDQFSLNLHREKPPSYIQSAMAVPIARKAIEQGWEWVLTPAERVFLYLPFEHSEDLADQETSIRLFASLTDSAPASCRSWVEGYLDYAHRHQRVVKRFGRFPDRNEVFGRKNTPEEESFLASDEAPF